MLRFWELAPSPNNTKVRMALRFKGIEFEPVPVDPFDRSSVVEASGQELTPVVADRGIVLNDSEAILQYMDANYRRTPRLFPKERTGRRECDVWRETLDREVASLWLPVFLFGIKGGTLSTRRHVRASRMLSGGSRTSSATGRATRVRRWRCAT